MEKKHILITGGAGYIGSMLTGVLLSQGYRVTVVDKLLFGGESLLGYWHHPYFKFIFADVCEHKSFQVKNKSLSIAGTPVKPVHAVVHLAAIVGFPACQAIGKEASWLYNTESTKRVFEFADQTGVERFIFSSTYSNYGLSKDGLPVTEDSPLNPQSIYAETKIAAEQYLLNQANGDAPSRCAPIVYRFATSVRRAAAPRRARRGTRSRAAGVPDRTRGFVSPRCLSRHRCSSPGAYARDGRHGGSRSSRRRGRRGPGSASHRRVAD